MRGLEEKGVETLESKRKLRLQISLIQIYEENASTQRKVSNWGLMYHQKCSLHKSLSALKWKQQKKTAETLFWKINLKCLQHLGKTTVKFLKVVIRKDLTQTPCIFMTHPTKEWQMKHKKMRCKRK